MAEAPSQAPQAETGVIFVGPWDEASRALMALRWPSARAAELAPGVTRIDLTSTSSLARPGFDDREGLLALSRTGPRRIAAGFFCDAASRSEGIRVFEEGRELERRRVEWVRAQPQDPAAWPIGALSAKVGLPTAAITRVPRPPRPPLALALEALLDEAPADASQPAELRHQALQLLGAMDHPRVTTILVKWLASEDWVMRFHAVRAYARKNRAPGKEGRPALDALLSDQDEGVRESALKGIGDLLPDVAFSDADLQRQIDAAIARGLADVDADVRAAAAETKTLRQKLLG